MSVRTLVCCSARAFFPLGCLSIATAGVRIVDLSGQGDHTTIQTAVDAAIDGDVILVRGGSYASFTVDNRALSIFADADAVVQVAGTLGVVNLALGKTLVVSGIKVTGTSALPAPSVALVLTNNAGALRFQACTFTGGKGLSISGAGGGGTTYPNAAHGAVLTNNPNVAFVACTLRGGDAWQDPTGCYECHGGMGGTGVLAQTSAVALYDSLCQGGAGSETGELGGNGGAGYHALDWGGFASRTTFKGGKGGNAWDFIYAQGGNGGHGLWVESGAGFHLLADVCVGGFGGISYLFPNLNGASGDPIHGSGLVDQLPSPARVFSATTLADTGGTIELTVYGQPGDQVFLPGSMRTIFKYKPAVSGVWLIPYPALISIDPLGVIPGSGVLTVTAPVMGLQDGIEAAVSFMQGFIIDDEGQRVLGSPIDVLILRCGSLSPDCNGNGRFDSCDLFQAQSIDCDANSIPDECQADCNGNSIADSCDIASHTSQDANHNGVPDECDPVNATWYVDANAAPGGNGSFSSPFKTIAQGVGIGLSGDTVIVRDGLYTGASNRNLDFTGRNLVVKSQNGPANCIIDCQQASRAFQFKSGENATARVEGFTIQNGTSLGSTFQPTYGGAIHVWASSPTIQGCIFTNCTGYTDGGALYIFDSNALVRDCTFTLNQVTNHGNAAGGAVECVHGLPKLVNCVFSNNTAPRFGGALALFPSTGQTMLVTNCVILSNTALQFSGGAVYMSAGGEGATFDNCLVAGNTAGASGGALAGNGTFVLSNMTIVGNHAGLRGGGIDRTQGGQGSIINSILWGNTAASGAQISLSGSSAGFSVQWCDSQGGQAAVAVDPGALLTWGAGNIALDPQFVDPNGPDANPLTVNDNDYRLSLLSPCIDAGALAGVALDLGDLDLDSDTGELVPFDLDFLPRFQNIPSVPDTGDGPPPIVDMGAYERQP